MVRIALCWARATNRREDAEREGCAAGLVPGTEDVTLEVDVDLATCGFAALAEGHAAPRWADLPQAIMVPAVVLMLQAPLELGLGVGALYRSVRAPTK